MVAREVDAMSDVGSPAAAFLPFALPDIGQEEIDEVVDSLRSGWITTGPKTRRFEQAFAEFLGGGVECVAVNSATAGLHLAVEALGIGPGDEVITTTHTFTATAEVVRYVGAHPVFVDIDPDTYCIDPELVDAAITERTRAIMPVHYAGHPCDMGRLHRVAERAGLQVIEDAAHALPTLCGGRLIGTLPSAATVFSFYATKTIATGEGGMLVTRSPEIAKRARVMRLHGIDRDAFDRYTSPRPAWYYEVVAPGFKYNLTDLAAALGLHQLRKADRFLERRARLAERYDAALADLPLALPPRPTAATGSHAWHLYVIRLLEGSAGKRDEVMQSMYEAGVGCSVHYVPLHLQPYWRDTYRLDPARFPNSQRLYESGFSLPIYTKMTDADQDRVIAALRDCLRPR
jgi:dTDP-4-amino-4,6-dideoxygalactose transaminase